MEKRLREGKTIDSGMEKVIAGEKEKWRRILRVVFDAIMFCAQNNLALRGSSDRIGTPQCGIFLNTIELISHYQDEIYKHISNILSEEKCGITYLSATII